MRSRRQFAGIGDSSKTSAKKNRDPKSGESRLRFSEKRRNFDFFYETSDA
jgi:hypothetical protein